MSEGGGGEEASNLIKDSLEPEEISGEGAVERNAPERREDYSVELAEIGSGSKPEDSGPTQKPEKDRKQVKALQKSKDDYGSDEKIADM